MKGRAKPTPADSQVLLEVGPRAAKLLVATTTPLQIQQVNASTISEQVDDPLVALRALLDEQPIAAKRVGLLFGREVFSLRTLELPSVDPKELASMLELQLGKLTPYPRSEILFASTPVASFREGYTTILLAVARKTLIEQVLQLCKARKIIPQWVGLSTEGLEAWWNGSGNSATANLSEGQLLAIVDVDFASTDCAVLSPAGRLIFSHSIPIGYEQLTTSEPAKLRWMGELVRLPRILLHEEVKGQVGQGILTGVTEAFEPIIEQLTSQWGVPVTVKDALESHALESVRARARITRSSYTALTGALLAKAPLRIDLTPPNVRVSQALQVRSKHLMRLSINMMVLLAVGLLLCFELIGLQQHYLGVLQVKLKPLEQTSRQVQQQQKAMQQIRDWLDPSRSALAVLQAIAASVNPEVAVTQVVFKENEPVKIRGTGNTSQSPYEFLDRLKKQRMMGAWPSCVAEVRVTGTHGTEFDITCKPKASG